MRHEEFYAVALLVRIAIWALLIHRASRHDLIRRYPLASAFVIVAFLTYASRMAAGQLIGADTLAYGYLYLFSELIERSIALALLLRYYYLPKKPSLRNTWPLVVAIPVVIALELLAQRQSHIILRTVNVTYFFHSILAGATLVHLYQNSHRLAIGKNIGYLLAAISFPAIARSTINTLYLHDPEVWSYGFTDIGLEVVDIASWAILILGLKEYDPPERVHREKPPPQQARREMIRLINALRRKA